MGDYPKMVYVGEVGYLVSTPEDEQAWTVDRVSVHDVVTVEGTDAADAALVAAVDPVRSRKSKKEK